MTTREIAHLTHYTQSYIARECRLGRLKSTLTTTGRRPEYHIEQADYEAWKSESSIERRAFKARTTNHYKARMRHV